MVDRVSRDVAKGLACGAMGRAERSHESTTSARPERPARRAHLRSVTPRRGARETVGEESQGGHLARLIREAGLNNNTLAKVSGVRRESISRVVNDHAGLGPRLAERIAPPLGVTVDELVLPRTQPVASRRSLELRLRELEDDRDYLLYVVRQLLIHLDNAGVGAPHVPAAPRSVGPVGLPPGVAAREGAAKVEAPAGQRRPRLPRHR